jgi:hypothetical protein
MISLTGDLDLIDLMPILGDDMEMLLPLDEDSHVDRMHRE